MLTRFYILNLFIVASIVAFVLLIITFPQISFSAAVAGVDLWFNIVLPSLLPFIIANELLIGLGFVAFLGILLEPFMRFVFNVPGAGAFAVAMGFSSGYPTGAKVTSSLYEKGLCTKIEAERLLTFTNNSGPLFIIGAVSVGMFNNPQLGILLALAHYASAITVGILFRWYKVKGHFSLQKKGSIIKLEKKEKNIFRRAFREMFIARKNDGRNLGVLIGDAVKNSVNLLLMIGGFIIFFSVIISLLVQLNIIWTVSSVVALILSSFGIDHSIISSALCGLFEITTGSKLAFLSSAPYIHRIVATAFILGWAGLSVHLQVISIISKNNLSPVPYLFAKFIQGIIAGLYTFLLFKFTIFDVFPTFNNLSPSHIPWIGYFVISSKLLIILFAILFILSIITYVKRKLFN